MKRSSQMFLSCRVVRLTVPLGRKPWQMPKRNAGMDRNRSGVGAAYT